MYVVLGVSGNTGKVVADVLLTQKKAVRVVVRDAAKGASWKARGAEVAVAELDDAAALTKALQGAEGAYLLVPPLLASSDARADNAKRIGALVSAVQAGGVGHVVLLSSIAAQIAQGTGPILSAHDAEVAFGATKTPTTFVRAAYFMENWGGSLYALGAGKVPTFLTADHAFPMVATRDIGETAARALVEGPHGKSVIELSGPRAYSPRDVAAALGKITKKTVELEVGPIAAMAGALKGAGLNDYWANGFVEMTEAINNDTIAFEGGNARAVRGVVELEEVLRHLVAGSGGGR